MKMSEEIFEEKPHSHQKINLHDRLREEVIKLQRFQEICSQELEA